MALNVCCPLQENLKTEGYLQEKIKQYYLNNSHRLTLVMSPQVR